MHHDKNTIYDKIVMCAGRLAYWQTLASCSPVNLALVQYSY